MSVDNVCDTVCDPVCVTLLEYVTVCDAASGPQERTCVSHAAARRVTARGPTLQAAGTAGDAGGRGSGGRASAAAARAGGRRGGGGGACGSDRASGPVRLSGAGPLRARPPTPTGRAAGAGSSGDSSTGSRRPR